MIKSASAVDASSVTLRRMELEVTKYISSSPSFPLHLSLFFVSFPVS